MRKHTRKLCFALIAAIVASSAWTAEAQTTRTEGWSDTFLGLNWELAGSFGAMPISISSARIDSLSLCFTYGKRHFPGFLTVRGRAGLGWWKGQPFMITLGFEIPVFEALSDSQARKFGLYLFGDAHARIPSTSNPFSFEPSLRLMLPLTATGGIAVGAGYDTARGPTWHIELMNGLYPLK